MLDAHGNSIISMITISSKKDSAERFNKGGRKREHQHDCNNIDNNKTTNTVVGWANLANIYKLLSSKKFI